MAHAAKIMNGAVTQVIVVNSCDFGGCDPHLDPENVRDHSQCGDLDFPEIEPNAQAFIASIGLGGDWRLTSYNSNFRGIYAGVGHKFDADADEFVAPVTEPVEAPVEEVVEA